MTDTFSVNVEEGMNVNEINHQTSIKCLLLSDTTGRDATARRHRPLRERLHAVPGQGVPQGILNRRVQGRDFSMMFAV